MDEIIQSVLKQLERCNILPNIPDSSNLPLSAINKVELYLSITCNGYYTHCITDSAPGEFLSLDIPDDFTIIVAPYGNAAFCCTYLWDFYDFIHVPANYLKYILFNALTIMLRNTKTYIDHLTIAVECDPGIAVFGYAAATGSACYQLMSGLRKHHGYY